MSFKEIGFDVEYLALVDALTVIAPDIVFKKTEDGKIRICRGAVGGSSLFDVIVSEEAFQFFGDCIAMENFSDFYRILTAYAGSTLSHASDTNKLLVVNSAGKINFVLDDEDALKSSPKYGDLGEAAFIFNLSKTDLADLKKCNSLVAGKYFKLSFADNTINASLSDLSFKNSFDKSFTMVSSGADIKDLKDFSIYSNFINQLPLNDYIVSVYKREKNNRIGWAVAFNHTDEKINLTYLTVQVNPEMEARVKNAT